MIAGAEIPFFFFVEPSTNPTDFGDENKGKTTSKWPKNQLSDTLIRFSPNMASFPCSPDSKSPWVRFEDPNVVCYNIYIYLNMYVYMYM